MKKILFSLLLAGLLLSCKQQHGKQQVLTFPQMAFVAAEKVHIPGDSTAIYLGGYGSSMAFNPVDSCFYLLTDRGPNVDGEYPESKVFPITDYVPTIGRFRLQGDSLVLIEKILLKDEKGQTFTGLPNMEGDGVTGEVAYDVQGNVISNAARGIDPEGLTIAPDGTFWVSDEYAPFIMQFDKSGKLLRELAPSKGLPAYYAKRRPNRGMEGLTISKDGKKLFGIMQSPLYMPDKCTKDSSVNNRIIEIELASGNTREYIYRMENPRNMASEICYVNDSVMLVLERDETFPIKGKAFKKVYEINISHASDVSTKEIELLNIAQMETQQIMPVTKNLFVDILTALPNYRHDKPEGITLIGDSLLCVINDDDFGITTTKTGGYLPKLDVNGKLDRNVVYFIPVNRK